MPRSTLQLAACALLSTLAIAQPPPAPPVDPRTLSLVEGVALGANRVPLPGANVALFGVSGTRAAAGIISSTSDQSISDSQGRFSFQNVVPGRYILDASHPDYSPGVGSTRVIRALQDGAIDSGPGSLLVTAGQHLTGIEINLIPMTLLSGKVTDENGDPMQNVTVRPMRADTILNGRRRLANAGAGVQTDAEGRYKLTVYSGRWYLSFMPSRQSPQSPAPADPEHTYITTYFPGVTEMPLAGGVDASGLSIPELNVRLRKTRIYHVRGKIVGVKPSPDFRIVPAQETGSARPSIVDEGRPVQEDGTFDVSGLTPGPWTLIVCQYGKLESYGRRSIRITDGDLNDVVISFQPPAELRGRVRTIPDQPIVNPPPMTLPQVTPGQGILIVSTGRAWSVQLTSLDPMLNSAGIEIQSDGAFTLKNIQAGRYRVDASVPQNAYVKSITLDGQPCLDSVIDLSSGATASGTLQIVVSMTAAEISGTVANPDGTALTTSTVTLEPDGLPGAVYRPDLRPVTKTDATGHFTLTGVAPGTYRVYAWEHVDPPSDLPAPGADRMPFADPDFPGLFDNMSALVTVAENDHKQVSLKLISGVKIDAASRGR